ncbi:MAG: complex I NDUFA9 subunit family protein [Halovenus sp.]
MQVLVTGGDGFVGRHLCAELAERGHAVTSLSRDPDPSVLPDDVETVAGDVTERDSIGPAVEGQDVVVNLVALSPLFTPKGGNEMHERVHLGGTKNVVAAAEDHGVSRIVQQSGVDADPDGPTHYLRAKGRAEEVVRDSNLEWVIFRPSIIFGDGDEIVPFTKRLKKLFAPGLPLYPLPGGGKKTVFQPIWVEDFAAIAADAVEEDDHVGQIHEIGGPEALTLREVTEKVYENEGKSVKIVPLPRGLAGIGLTALGILPGFPMDRDQYHGLQVSNISRNDVDAFDVDADSLRTFDAYLGLE